MTKLTTTKMSSKGQVVIPELIRDELHLEAGTQFIVVGEGDTVILKSIRPPSKKEFSKLMNEAKIQAKKAGIEKADLDKAIIKARKSK